MSDTAEDAFGLDKGARNAEAARQEAEAAGKARRSRSLNPPPPYRVVPFDPAYFGVLGAPWEEEAN